MSIMLLLKCVSCKKRQQIRQGLVQACACGGADFVCVAPPMPFSGAVTQLEVPPMPQPTHVANIDFDNSASADRVRAAMNTVAELAQSTKSWLRVERVREPREVDDGYDLDIVLMDTNGLVPNASPFSVRLGGMHARRLGGREHQRMADEAQRLRDENAKLKVELFDLTRENETLKRKATVKR